MSYDPRPLPVLQQYVMKYIGRMPYAYEDITRDAINNRMKRMKRAVWWDRLLLSATFIAVLGLSAYGLAQLLGHWVAMALAAGLALIISNNWEACKAMEGLEECRKWLEADLKDEERRILMAAANHGANDVTRS